MLHDASCSAMSLSQSTILCKSILTYNQCEGQDDYGSEDDSANLRWCELVFQDVDEGGDNSCTQ